MKAGCLFLLAIFAVLSSKAQIQYDANGITYCMPSGTANGGNNWTNPANLSRALLEAKTNSNIQEIWVSGGIYYPQLDTLGNTATTMAMFPVRSGLKLYGGLNPATATIATVHSANYTINPADSSLLDGQQVSYHVLLFDNADSTTLLHGFNILNGNANGVNSDDRNGGGMVVKMGAPRISACFFANNSAAAHGCGIYSYGSFAHFDQCVFRSNSSGQYGGAIHCLGNSPEFNHCMFTNNHADVSGGAISTLSPIHTGIYNSMFLHNSCGETGGAVNDEYGNTSIINCSFAYNTVTSGIGIGGAVFSCALTLDVVNCTFLKNTAVNDGYAIGTNGSIVFSLSNTVILGGNNGNDFYGSGGGAVQHVVISDSSAATQALWFSSVNESDTDFLHLADTAPGINAGDTALYPIGIFNGLDAAGNNRLFSCSIDLGSFENLNAGLNYTQPTDATVCIGDNALFVVNSPGSSFQWQIDKGAGFQDTIGATNDTLIVANASLATSGWKFRAIVTNCIKIDITDFALLSVQTVITPSIVISSSDTIITQGQTVTFTATATNGGSSPIYQWRRNNVNTGNGTPIFTTICNPGDIVTCVLSSSLSCASDPAVTSNDVELMDEATSITSVKAYPSQIEIYPSPATEYIHIQSPMHTHKEATLWIYDVHQKLVSRMEYSGADIPVDISKMPSGHYFIRIADDRTSAYGRFLKN